MHDVERKTLMKAYQIVMFLLEDYNVGDIDVSTIVLNDGVSVDSDSSTEIGDYDADDITDLMVKFDRAEVIDSLSTGEATLTITAKLNEKLFKGTDTVKVID